MKLPWTCLAGNGRAPVVLHIHMLDGGRSSAELTTASFTVKSGCPVVQGIHMLIASLLGTELSVACLAFNPMTGFIHVLPTVLPIMEVLNAGTAFEHCANAKGRLLGGGERGWINKKGSNALMIGRKRKYSICLSSSVSRISCTCVLISFNPFVRKCSNHTLGRSILCLRGMTSKTAQVRPQVDLGTRS